MNINYQSWRRLIIFCLGLAIGTSLCMKWLESDFYAAENKFSIMGLELFYDREKVAGVLSSLDSRSSAALSYHLYFDFVFMAGIFPGITSLCMMAREKVKSGVMRKTLLVAAILQLPAWGCDITENCFLLNWLSNPVIDDNFSFYHFIVALKWIIALSAFSVSVAVLWLRRKIKIN